MTDYLIGFNYCLPGSFVESPAVSWSHIYQKPIHYCDELLVWAALLSPFIAIQQVHPWRRHILTTSWLQIGHMHFSLLDRSLILFWFFSLAFKYNHNAINDNPIIVKIRNILMPDPIASKNIPNAMNPNPYINSQSRVRRLFFLFNVISCSHFSYYRFVSLPTELSHSVFIPIYLKSHEVPMTEGSILAIHYIDHVLLHGKVKIRHLGMGLIWPKVGVTVIMGVIRIEKCYLSLWQGHLQIILESKISLQYMPEQSLQSSTGQRVITILLLQTAVTSCNYFLSYH